MICIYLLLHWDNLGSQFSIISRHLNLRLSYLVFIPWRCSVRYCVLQLCATRPIYKLYVRRTGPCMVISFVFLSFFSPMGRVAWICKCWDGKVGQFGKSSNLKSRYHFSKFPVATGYEKLWFVCRFYFVDRYTQSFEIQLTKFPGNETEQTIILKIWFAEYNIRSLFLGSPGNLTGPKPYFKIKN